MPYAVSRSKMMMMMTTMMMMIMHVICGLQVFRCLSCDYRFGNLSDLKRHLKIKHHVQVQDIAGMEHMHISEVEVWCCKCVCRGWGRGLSECLFL